MIINHFFNFQTVFVVLVFLSCSQLTTAQEVSSTEKLNFLIGNWKIERIYSPNSENKRELKGSLSCELALDGTFIECTYDMERPGKTRGLDVVYFNYNPIYNLYESLWLSSTWPIKVLMQGDLTEDNNEIKLKTSAQFLIENNVTEYVMGELFYEKDKTGTRAFSRKTFIRTSNDKEDLWHHHMTEIARRIDN